MYGNTECLYQELFHPFPPVHGGPHPIGHRAGTQCSSPTANDAGGLPVLVNLIPYSLYGCRVSANTSVGEGNFSSTQFNITDESGKYFNFSFRNLWGFYFYSFIYLFIFCKLCRWTSSLLELYTL